jgi:hypothetical protein
VAIEDQPNPDGESGQPSDEYKNLQRQLSKAQNIAKEVIRSSVDANAALATAARTEEMMLSMLEQTDPEAAGEARVKRQGQMEIVQSQHELTDLLSEHDTDWQDDRLDASRELFNAGDVKGAAAAAHTALDVDPTEDIESRIEQRVREALGVTAGQVDTGQGIASGGGPITPAQAREMMSGHDSDSIIEGATAFLDRIYSKRK